MASQRTNIVTGNSGASSAISNGYRSSAPPPAPSPLSPPISPPSVNNNANNLFNPRLILSQIISLQSFHYVVLGVIFQINHVLFATSITTDRIFTAKHLDIWSASGWIDCGAVLMSSFIGWVYAVTFYLQCAIDHMKLMLNDIAKTLLTLPITNTGLYY